MIGGGSWCDLVNLPRATFDAVFAKGPGVIVAGAFNPSGSITPVNGGYRVEGRWAFASGCEHADWIFGNCVEGLVDGHPMLRAALFTPDDIVIEDTWTATGMCATASHHFRVEDLSLPPDRTFVPLEGEPCIDEPIARVHTPAFVSLVVSSVALGIARGALEDVFALAAGKVPHARRVAAGDEPAVPARRGRRRCGAAGFTKPAARDCRGDLGGGGRGSTAVARGDRLAPAPRRPGPPSARRTSSTPRSGSAAARPSTPTHPCSVASATSTPSPSTSSCAPTPSPRPAPSSPGRSPMSPSSRPPRHPRGSRRTVRRTHRPGLRRSGCSVDGPSQPTAWGRSAVHAVGRLTGRVADHRGRRGRDRGGGGRLARHRRARGGRCGGGGRGALIVG